MKRLFLVLLFWVAIVCCCSGCGNGNPASSAQTTPPGGENSPEMQRKLQSRQKIQDHLGAPSQNQPAPGQ